MMRQLMMVLVIGVTCAAPVPAQERADLILSNGAVFSGNGSGTVYDTIVVRDGRVLALGGPDLLGQYRADRVVNLDGRLVTPGFNDTSMSTGGGFPDLVDLAGSTSIDEIGFRIHSKAEALGPGRWVRASGWIEGALVEGRRPGKQDLDIVAPDNPVVVGFDRDSVLVNQAALDVANITWDTASPDGGEIELGPGSQPTGVLRGTARRLVEKLIPAATAGEEGSAFLERLRALPALGITSLVQAGTGAWHVRNWMNLYARHGEGLPRAAVRYRVPSDAKRAAAAIRALGKISGDGDDRMRVGALSVVVDGGLGWTLEPYRDRPDYYGQPAISEDELYELVKDAHDLGWQIGFETIGDAAIQMTVDVLSRVLDESPRPDHRHYLASFTVLPPSETMMIMAQRGILIAQQPSLVYTETERYKRHFTANQLDTVHPLRTPMNHGLVVALGSGGRPIDPLLGLYSATTRLGISGDAFGTGERLTMAEAIGAYTSSGAFLTSEEDVKGTLVPGMFADLVVLSGNLLEIDPRRTPEVVVDMTVIDGRVVYER